MKIDYINANPDTPDHHRKGFIEAYKEAFGGPPYYEKYTDNDVIDTIWNPHLLKGIIILACEDNAVVGFGCAKPLLNSPSDVQEFLQEKRLSGDFPIEFSDVWYMSEVGVRNTHRRQGIGLQLIGKRLARILELQGRYYVMRTAANNSNSIGLYKKIGAIEISGAQDVSGSEQVQVQKSQSTARLYFYSNCEAALKKIP